VPRASINWTTRLVDALAIGQRLVSVGKARSAAHAAPDCASIRTAYAQDGCAPLGYSSRFAQ
jgi:hypothetical protein